MSDHKEQPIEFVPQGTSIVGRWGFLLDNLPEEIGAAETAVLDWLRSRDYEIHYAPNLPIDADVGPELPGTPG